MAHFNHVMKHETVSEWNESWEPGVLTTTLAYSIIGEVPETAEAAWLRIGATTCWQDADWQPIARWTGQ